MSILSHSFFPSGRTVQDSKFSLKIRLVNFLYLHRNLLSNIRSPSISLRHSLMDFQVQVINSFEVLRDQAVTLTAVHDNYLELAFKYQPPKLEE